MLEIIAKAEIILKLKLLSLAMLNLEIKSF